MGLGLVLVYTARSGLNRASVQLFSGLGVSLVYKIEIEIETEIEVQLHSTLIS